MALDAEARDVLATSLGGDRGASLSEIEKLALYARGQSQVSLDDVEAVVSDVAGSVLNTLIDAAFDGRRREGLSQHLRHYLKPTDWVARLWRE